MSFVFKINQELASIAVTASELASVTRAITGIIQSPEFLNAFGNIIAQINKSYAVVTDSFSPFLALDSEPRFKQLFDDTHQAFKRSYLMDVSKPRRYCDDVYDAYLAMQQTKEAKTTFPLLKRNFLRLDALYDKWINNDAYLPMSIDAVLKLQNRLLNEISELKAKDAEDAYILFSSAMEDLEDYLTLINAKNSCISELVQR